MTEDMKGMIDYKEELRRTLEVLRKGGIFLYPTDTVWGLGCDATDPEAVARIYALKHRSDSKSLVLLASDVDMICRYVREIPEMAVQLIEVNDRPMTIIYPGALHGEAGQPADRHILAYNVVAEDDKVGMRTPMLDFCREIVAAFGRPIVSTSANISGEPTPKSFSEITKPVLDGVDYVVDRSLEGGSTGQASSIIKVGLDASIEIIRK